MGNYVEIHYTLDGKKFSTVVIRVEENHDYIDEYLDPAVEKLCEELNYKKEEVRIVDYKFIGKNFLFLY